jgi:hypothetical protein
MNAEMPAETKTKTCETQIPPGKELFLEYGDEWEEAWRLPTG